MKPSATTLFGSAAAVSFAGAQVPGLPAWMTTAFNIGAAVSMALLGKHAADCPANCPGTDRHGRPNPPTRLTRIPVTGLSILAVVLMLASGCTVPNPRAKPSRPNQPGYIVNPAMNEVSNAAVQLAHEVGTLTQTGPVLPMAVTGLFTAAAAIAGMVAQHRSHRAALARSQGPPSTRPKKAVDATPPRA